MELRGVVLGPGLRICDGGERLVVHLDKVECVVRLISVFGHDDRDDVTGVANDVGGDRLITGDLEVGVGQQPGAWHRLEVTLDVRAGIHGNDAGC